MNNDRRFAANRDTVLNKLQEHSIVPIDLRVLEDSTVNELGLDNFFHTYVLPFNLHTILGQIVDRLFKKSPDEKIHFNINDDLDAISWIISYGICNEKGEAYFDEKQAIMFSSKYKDLTYYFCWEVLKTNGFTREAKQALVGNSEGTKASEISSEQQAT